MESVSSERQSDTNPPPDGATANGIEEGGGDGSGISSEYDTEEEEEFRRQRRDVSVQLSAVAGGEIIVPKVIPLNPVTSAPPPNPGLDFGDIDSDTSDQYCANPRFAMYRSRGGTRHKTFRLRDVTETQGGDEFEFLSPEEEPVIPKKVRNRATKALKRAARDLLKPKKHQKCTCSCPIIEEKSKDKTSEPPATNLTPELKHASIQGWKMMRDVFFPAIPALLQDIWVYTELGISLFAFIFGLVDLFPIEDNAAFQIVYLVLTIISIILALIDANIYFFQLGSCVRAYRTCRIYIETRKNETSSELDQGESKDDLECNNTAEEDEKLAWYRLSTKWKERLTTWFDLIRTIASELLLYPLVIFDLFDFVTGAGYRAHSTDDRVNFSLFVVGGFYLILAVYIMRIFMVGGALSSLVKIPLIKRPSSGDGGNHIDMIVKFCIHLIGQIVVHLMILVVIGAKIANENIDSEMMLQINTSNASNSSGSGLGDQANTIRASAFLAVAIILGSVIPLIGIIMFFVANYYWMQEFSIVLWVDMVSLLQGQGFAETVFGGEGTAPSNELAQSFAKNTSYSTVKKQLRRFKSPPFYRKFLHPARVPLAGISCFIYGATLVIFIFSLALTTDENGIVLVAVFKNDNILTVSFVIITLCVVMANIHILVLFAIGMVVLLLIGIIAIPTITLLTFVVIFIYVPLLIYYLVRNMVLDRQSSRKAGAFELQELDSITNDSGHNSSKTKSLEQVVITDSTESVTVSDS